MIIDIHRDRGVQPTTTIIEKQPTVMINLYEYRVVNPYVGGRGIRGGFGERVEFSHMYYVYIHK